MDKKESTTYGIIDEGVETLYDNVKTEGFDVGLWNKGKRTKVLNSNFKSKLKLLWHQKWWGVIVIGVIIGLILYILGWN